MSEKKRQWGEASLIRLLRERHAGNAWAFMQHVRNGTGWQRTTRTADAIAMGLWPSRGLHLHGFEVKVSRSDWLVELRNPAKADEIAGLCDFWWLVAADASIVQMGELPATWGLLVPTENGKALRVATAATQMEPKPIDRVFLAAVLRRAQVEQGHEAAVKEAVEAARQQWQEELEEEVTKRLANRGSADAELAKLRKALAEFQEKSGIDISEWNAGEMGEAVYKVMRGSARREAKWIVERTERMLADAREVLRELDKLEKRPAPEAQQLALGEPCPPTS